MSVEESGSDVGSDKDPPVSLQEVIKAFLQTHQFLHQYRLQKLIYLAELMYREKHEGRPLTEAEYKPYMYGAYSEDVDDTLSELRGDPEVKAENQHRYRNSKTTYKGEIEDLDIPSDVEDLVEVVTNMTRRMSSDDLAQWSKSTYLFDETDYNDEMEFEKYLSAIREGEVEPDWKKIS
ncbi:unknown [Haloarcula marismortui ATCC 43049]|uniref:DUF4065 domain-containing protein n=1 Tax=Haloarcula marismortui (strain ATCC 43049 / DSM 3752 / JCM 8966 / VKM B-1809) TaxID=272569 RepID=Q5V010_HALMA|nr:Panacea domain-containing protein [Haloarcula marismortui]AAV47143.1 unknown [Haloarcula marismortui ATCC 43049]QCP91848.1 DUF4065 domain-containing protein [Haloarcula marismortui ATCC 43049]